MKNILTLALLIISSLVLAQSKNSSDIHVDERLFAVYEASYLNQLKEVNPFLLKRWSFYLDHAFFLTDYVKPNQENTFPEVNISDIENINILLLEKEQNLKKKWKVKSIYKIKGTNKYLVYHSGNTFNEKLREHLGFADYNRKIKDRS